MFFVLAKILGFFAAPSNVLVSLGILGVLLMATRFARSGRRLAVFSLIGLAIAGWSPLGNALILPLEERFPPWDASRGAPAGIISLGGAVDTVVSPVRGEVALNEAAERMTAMAELLQRYPQAHVVFSGGSGRLIYDGATEAEFAVRLFESFGIEKSRIILENRSRDTDENARFTKELVQPKDGERWLIVTSAHHMPRAVGAFRAIGFPVEAFPVDYRTRGAIDMLRPFSNVGDGLRRTDTAMREWIGLVVYRISGRTADLLPAP
ncbi:MAG TPA: YdcF family protein, partial [Xanthobacteraceae bacterium]|nr:YdcF family protein [Xanthobacteraceae bacterium]